MSSVMILKCFQSCVVIFGIFTQHPADTRTHCWRSLSDVTQNGKMWLLAYELVNTLGIDVTCCTKSLSWKIIVQNFSVHRRDQITDNKPWRCVIVSWELSRSNYPGQSVWQFRTVLPCRVPWSVNGRRACTRIDQARWRFWNTVYDHLHTFAHYVCNN